MSFTNIAGIVKSNLMFSGHQEMVDRLANHYRVWQLMQMTVAGLPLAWNLMDPCCFLSRSASLTVMTLSTG